MAGADPYAPPEATLHGEPRDLQYVGFWKRVGATLVDTILQLAVTFPILYVIYGRTFVDSEEFVVGTADFVISYILPACAVLLFWYFKSATPGKMLLGARIVDAYTGKKPPAHRLLLRYLGYFLSSLVLGLGFLWVAWDSRKQGFHDKLANTVVVSPGHNPNLAVRFD